MLFKDAQPLSGHGFPRFLSGKERNGVMRVNFLTPEKN